MPIYSTSESDSDDARPTSGRRKERKPRSLGRQKKIRSLVGEGKVADVLLWRDKRVSASLLVGVTVIWFLFEVAEYNFVTLFCHICITTMLVAFIWCKAAEFFNWKQPGLPETILNETTLREVAYTFRARFNRLLPKLLDIAYGKEPAHFILALSVLYIVSVIGTYVSFVNLLFLGFLCLETLPFMYDRYEKDVDDFALKAIRRMKKMFRTFDSQVLNKIPRGPVKD